MSKAFDTVSRPKLLKDLSNILNEDELHMMSILIKDVTLTVKVGNNIGSEIQTEIGIAQGDCLSAVLFIFYLARSIDPSPPDSDHTYASTQPPTYPPEHEDHNYYIPARDSYFEIDPKYADDISWATTAKHRVEQIKTITPPMLKKRNLLINDTKTEEFEISRKGDCAWKSCKLLGSLLDTEKDINRRKILAIDAYKTLSKILNGHKNSLTIKLRAFNAYVASIFLYNSEIWTLTKHLEAKIDAFQRRHLRKIIGYQWPKKISNKDLHEKTKTEPWSNTIKRRRLNWLGHLMRLHPDTPARRSLEEYLRKTKRPRGRPQLTWMERIKEDLKPTIVINLQKPEETIRTLCNLTHDRDTWRAIVKCVMLQQ